MAGGTQITAMRCCLTHCRHWTTMPEPSPPSHIYREGRASARVKGAPLMGIMRSARALLVRCMPKSYRPAQIARALPSQPTDLLDHQAAPSGHTLHMCLIFLQPFLLHADFALLPCKCTSALALSAYPHRLVGIRKWLTLQGPICRSP